MLAEQSDVKHVLHSAFLVFIAILGVGFIIPFLPSFSEKIGSKSLIGFIYSGFAFARLLAVPTFAMISDRLGRKPVILAGLGVYSIASFLYVVSYDALSLFVVRLVHGLASSMIIPVCFAYAFDHTREGKEGFSAGFLGGSLLLGLGLGPVVGGFVGEKLGEAYAFYFMGAMGIFAFVYALSFISDSKAGVKKVHEKLKDSIRAVFSSHVFLFSFCVWFAVMFQRGTVISYFPIFLEESNIGKLRVGAFFTLYSIVSSVFQYVSGSFVDRFRDKFIPTFFFGTVSYALLISFLAGNGSIVIVSVALSGLFSSLVYPFVMAEIGAEARKAQKIGGTIGFMDWAFSFGNIFGPISMGVISKYVGLEYMFVTLSAFGIVFFLFLFMAYKQYKGRSSDELNIRK